MVNKNKVAIALFACAAAALLWGPASRAQENMPVRQPEEILKIHKALLESHLRKDAEGVLAAESDSVVVVSRGEVLFPKRQERLRQFTRYLENSEFERYEDAIAPIIRVSTDGTMAWLIAQVRIIGVRRDDDGGRVPFESTWAWIELYEKRGDRWLRVGEVSNMQPPRTQDTN